MATKSVTAAPIFATLAFAVAAGCTAPIPGQEYNDPYEGTNRRIHSFNVALDSALMRPASEVILKFPPAVTDRAAAFADNLAGPGLVVNGVLQGRLDHAAKNTLRFVINSTLGLFGLFDPATEMGLSAEPTDFGETLAVWGVREGAYVELPIFGPSTERDAFGLLADFFLDPVGSIATAQQLQYVFGVRALNMAIDRGTYADLIDSILYESVDGYAQGRLLYLQNRRFTLGESAGDAYLDPYADLYIDPYEEF